MHEESACNAATSSDAFRRGQRTVVPYDNDLHGYAFTTCLQAIRVARRKKNSVSTRTHDQARGSGGGVGMGDGDEQHTQLNLLCSHAKVEAVSGIVFHN